MRRPDRIPRIIHSLEKLWERNPQQRLGQILANIASYKSNERLSAGELFNLEDNEWEDLIDFVVCNGWYSDKTK